MSGMFVKFFLEFVTVPLILLLIMAAALEFGGRLRQRHQLSASSDDSDSDGGGVVDGAVFALMGLLLAFAFSGAAGRFDMRRQLIVEEVNSIGTAWLRIDVLPPAEQTALREKFRQYVDSRLQTYGDVTDLERVSAGLASTAKLQNEIWILAVAGASKASTTAPSMLLLPSLNDMFDIVTTRSAASQMHPPGAIYALLVLVMVLCAILAGYRMGSSGPLSRLHRLSFVGVLAVTYYVIIDLEYPRMGFIRVDKFDQLLQQLQASLAG